MTVQANPFFEVYVGDRLTSNEFVNIFSPFLVDHAQALFVPGNVVVKGVQGSGKSMLLTLFKSDVRLEYGRAGANFPVRGTSGAFIGAGVNLAHGNAMDFGYRSISDDPAETALFFADFVNYQIILDLFRSLRTLSRPANELPQSPEVDLSREREEAFVDDVQSAVDFQGTLAGCRTIADLEERIAKRVNSYVRYLHRNDRELDESIRLSKTDMGTPISAIVTGLKRSGIVKENVPVFIHIDQYEELANISSGSVHAPDYRAVVNRALARRDPTISYRIGTRGHAWRNHALIHGTSARLEEERDYKFVDLDLLLKREENRKTWIFPTFVADVFARRLRHVGLAPKDADGQKLLDNIFGEGIPAPDKARRYGGRNPRRAVKLEDDWPEAFRTELLELSEDDPLEARLIEARALQRVDRAAPAATRLMPEQLSMAIRDDVKREWWRKERIELALVQIAGRCQERPIWSGRDEIIDLSGGNILTFLNICQNVWDTQSQLGQHQGEPSLVHIESDIQAIGVFKSSDYWLKKILRETGHSGDRSRFAKQLGVVFARRLHDDRQMSNPGHNGLSLLDDELLATEFNYVRNLLEEMVDYGTLISSPHTTKERNRRARTKFYLNPVLCPYFKIPYKRLKEPIYVHAGDVEDWIREAGLPVPESSRARRSHPSPAPLPLFER